MIDAFETLESWWEPAGAGQTAGIIADQTSRVLNNSIVATSESRSSLALNYGWDVNYSGTPMIVCICRQVKAGEHSRPNMFCKPMYSVMLPITI